MLLTRRGGLTEGGWRESNKSAEQIKINNYEIRFNAQNVPFPQSVIAISMGWANLAFTADANYWPFEAEEYTAICGSGVAKGFLPILLRARLTTGMSVNGTNCSL